MNYIPQSKIGRNVRSPKALLPSSLEQKVEAFKLNRLAEEILDFKKQAEKNIEDQLTKINEVAEETNKALQEVRRISQRIENDFDSMTNEVVSLLKEIKSQGLKGDKGEDGMDADEQKVIAEVAKMVPRSDEIVKEVLTVLPKNKPSLKVIQESIDIDAVSEKVKESLELEKDWEAKWNKIKLEISRSKQGYHGGGFNNIANASGTVSTGLDTLKFTGSGVSSVSQVGRTVVVDITGGSGSYTVLTTASTIDDSNTTFVFTGTPTGVIINGQTYLAGETSGGVVMWTNVGSTVTTAFPVGTGGSISAFSA